VVVIATILVPAPSGRQWALIAIRTGSDATPGHEGTHET